MDQFLKDLKAILGRFDGLGMCAQTLLHQGVRFITLQHPERIGNISHELDSFVKEEALGLRPAFKGVVLAPSDRVCNLHYLNYWHKYFTLSTKPGDCAVLSLLAQQPALRLDFSSYWSDDSGNGKAVSINAQWEQRPPLLSLSAEDRQKVFGLLEDCNIPSTAWFVCVDAQGSDGDPAGADRDADIFNYIEAMKEVVRRGGVCIRVGDPRTKPLPSIPGVIDYAHHPRRCEAFDVFLLASCRFLLGSSSGLAGIARTFGVPTALANLTPVSRVPHTSADIGIFKLIWSSKLSRFLNFSEMLEFATSGAEHGCTVVDNSPRDILALASEMLDRTNAVSLYAEDDEVLQRRFKALFEPHPGFNGGGGRVGRDFLRQHRDLLLDRADGAVIYHPQAP